MNWAYLAGFTDGDGCISREMAKGKYSYAFAHRMKQKYGNKYRLHLAKEATNG